MRAVSARHAIDEASSDPPHDSQQVSDMFFVASDGQAECAGKQNGQVFTACHFVRVCVRNTGTGSAVSQPSS